MDFNKSILKKLEIILSQYFFLFNQFYVWLLDYSILLNQFYVWLLDYSILLNQCNQFLVFHFLLLLLSAFLRNFFLCQDRLSNDVPPHLAQPCYVALGLALDLRYRNARPNMVNYYLCVPFVCVNIFLPMKTCFFLGIKLLNSYWVQNKKLVIS